jgi:hypothetical protein
MSLREEYIAKMKIHLDEMEVHLAQLELKARSVETSLREKYEVELTHLRFQSQQAMKKFDELKASSADTWDGMVAEADKIKAAAIRSLHYFRSQL